MDTSMFSYFVLFPVPKELVKRHVIRFMMAPYSFWKNVILNRGIDWKQCLCRVAEVMLNGSANLLHNPQDLNLVVGSVALGLHPPLPELNSWFLPVRWAWQWQCLGFRNSTFNSQSCCLVGNPTGTKTRAKWWLVFLRQAPLPIHYTFPPTKVEYWKGVTQSWHLFESSLRTGKYMLIKVRVFPITSP